MNKIRCLKASVSTISFVMNRTLDKRQTNSGLVQNCTEDGKAKRSALGRPEKFNKWKF